MRKVTVSLNQVKGFEQTDLALFRKRIQEEAQRRRGWFMVKLNLYKAIQHALQEELAYVYRAGQR